jgi:poly-gamma-glutamate synthesis protein (capsule biosynthesis protein)
MIQIKPGLMMLFVLVSVLFPTCLKSQPAAEAAQEAAVESAQEPTVELVPEAPPPPDEITIVAVGDNLYHETVMKLFLNDNTFDFAPYYQFIQPLAQAADIAFVNQETILGGKEFGFSAYPSFNTPQEVGKALIGVGFNVINQATNHTLDRGVRPVLATIDFWDQHPEVDYLGIFPSQEARDAKQVIIERNNIKVGFLSYTYGLNGLTLPADRPYLISLIDTEVMAKEIDALRPLCDYLVVSMHWGVEYDFQQNERQETLARFLAEHNVDLVIGHHPHVLQPVEVLPRADGGLTYCFYSLGNFISSQMPNYTMLGGMMYLKVQRTDDGLLVVESGVIPLVTHFEPGSVNFRIYPLYEYTDALAAKHLRNTKGNEISVAYFNSLAARVLGDALIDHNPYAEAAP